MTTIREAIQIKKRPNLGTFPKGGGGGVSAKIKKFTITNSKCSENQKVPNYPRGGGVNPNWEKFPNLDAF